MKRLVQLWFTFYLSIYCLPFPFGFFPGTGPVIKSYFEVLINTADWVGIHVLGLEQVGGPTGSGDTRANYILIGIFAVLAFVAALLWKICVRVKSDQGLRLCVYHYVRFTLANALLFYGWDKIILPGQFGSLTPGRLMESYGDSSPMGLLWTFMAASKPYTIFAGVLEVFAGSLLFIRRFVSLGSLLSIGIMTNVFMLNICYDVPVKLFSFHLLLFSIFLVAPDLKRLLRFFIFNLPTESKVFPHLFQTPRRIILVTEFFLIFGLSTSAIQSNIKATRYYQKSIEEVKFFGVWNVLKFSEANGDGPFYNRWARVVFDLEDQVYVRTSNGDWLRFRMERDYNRNKFNLAGTDGLTISAQFTYTQSTIAELLISGQIDSKNVSFLLEKETGFKVPLKERKFHWVTELPFER